MRPKGRSSAVFAQQRHIKELFHRPRLLQVPATKTDHVIDELEPNTNCEIRLSAVNNYGRGEHTESLVVCTGTPFKRPLVEEAPVIMDITNEVTSLPALGSNFMSLLSRGGRFTIPVPKTNLDKFRSE